ncbi:MAG: BlaI/MecI/CopY family transcriptional regulator [Bryobacteraceae bacterium]|nr:BlaI/MecI/CopY family transcriptional regulator [Bryobacteraceae bacterium]MCX7605588.1 BlaI/MecI/CopY family transcriptional regulator [Bryobacteraceae bacterium]
MPRKARDIPPPLELRCLAALWKLGEANVRAVREFLAPRRPLAYTTVMTMLERLTRKQFLTRRKVGRSFVYRPVVSRDVIRSLAVQELLDLLFDGSPQGLIQFLGGAPPEAPPGAPAEESEGRPLDAALL